MKFLVRVEADRHTVIKLKKGPRQMVSQNSRLYRVDDQYMLKDLKSGNQYVIYDIDGTQPRLDHLEYVSPDITRALIASAKTAKTKKTIWANLSGGHAMQWLTVIIVVVALAYGFLVKML